MVAKSAKKGRRDAEDAEACVVVYVIALPLVVAYFCSCCRKGNFQALVCTTTKKAKARSLCMWCQDVRSGTLDARRLNDVRREITG